MSPQIWPLPSSLQSALLLRGRNVRNSHLRHSYLCWICGQSVDLETCKVDEHGVAVHGLCYFVKVALDGKSSAPPMRKPAHRVTGLYSVQTSGPLHANAKPH